MVPTTPATDAPPSGMIRSIWLVVGLVGAALLAYVVAYAVLLVAVFVGAAPLGLAGESTPTQPWVGPAAVVAAVATLITVARVSIRRFRRTRP